MKGKGWVGSIPLNDQFCLEVDTRVPISNLERILSVAPRKSIKSLSGFQRTYSGTYEKPSSLIDIMTDQLLLRIEEIFQSGLIKRYRRERYITNNPSGKIKPFHSALLSSRKQVPIAVCEKFVKSSDTRSNQVLKFALCKLVNYYEDREKLDQRSRELKRNIARFSDLGVSTINSCSTNEIELLIDDVPNHRYGYANALGLARLINMEMGIRVRSWGRFAEMPSVFIDMANVFESYAREILQRNFKNYPDYSVLDGNVSGHLGSKQKLFCSFALEGAVPPATPDIVIRSNSQVELIIDVKYKPPRRVPDRSDINQVICYGESYKCSRVMILYPSSTNMSQEVKLVGRIGSIDVFTGIVNLNSNNLVISESEFSSAVYKLLKT
ncbi:MAG: hypothetical protein AAF572_27115 [Cyanobacteria bacterium P01_B01_bin.77]